MIDLLAKMDFLRWVGCLILLSLYSRPSFAQPVQALGRAAIRPSLVRLAPGERRQFHAVMLPRRLEGATLTKEVVWSVNGIKGGNRRVGTISKDGEYRAPKTIPSLPEIIIGAETPGAANRLLWATVLIGDQAPAYELEAAWGEPSEDAPHLKDPHGLAREAGGSYLIADMGVSRVFRYAADGTFVKEFGPGPGNVQGSFDAPRDIAVDGEGRVFVCDARTGPPRLQVFDADGGYLFGFAQKGTGPGQVLRIQGMGFDPDGRFIVTDIDNMRVSIYTAAGEFIEAWEKDGENLGQFNAPYGLAIDPNGDVFVPNFYGPCQKFSRSGVFLHAFAEADPPEGPTCFCNATGDQWGNVYLATRREGVSPGDIPEEGRKVTIMKFNNNGDFITSFDLPEDEQGEADMVVDESGRIHVVFKRTERMGVEVYRPR